MCENKVIGYAFIVGDLLHYGHLRFLKKCKEYCSFLIVGVFTDELCKSYKRKPIIPFKQRIELIDALKVVDLVIKVEDKDQTIPMMRLVAKGFTPTYLFHADDWKLKEHPDLVSAKKYIESINGKLIQPSYTNGISTTHIINKIVMRTMNERDS